MSSYKELAEFYNLSYQTVSKWAKTRPLIFKAMRSYYENLHN